MSHNQNLPISKSPNNNSNNQHQALKCPRCNSPNTKFCYYNNYSLSQPRHFCKTCRRYWTRGGALRNVPVGGGCRKTKKSLKSCNNTTTPPCSSSSSRFFSSAMEDPKFFNGLLVSNSPAIDFQPSNLQLEPSTSIGESNYESNLSLMGYNNFSLTNSGPAGNIASSIETLSSLNQDLHFKLQQQRMAMIFGHQNQKETINGPDQSVRLQPILFQNLETDSSRKEGSPDAVAVAAGAGTEWLFGNIPTYVSSVNVQDWNDTNQFNVLH